MFDGLLVLPKGIEGNSQVAVRHTFPSPVAHFLCNCKVFCVMFDSLLVLPKGIEDISQVAVC